MEVWVPTESRCLTAPFSIITMVFKSEKYLFPFVCLFKLRYVKKAVYLKIYLIFYSFFLFNCPSFQQPQQQNQNQPQTIIKTILPVNNGQKQPLPNNNQVQLQPGQRVVPVPITTTLVTSTTPGSPVPPGSPILTHLLHRQNEVAPSIDPKRDEINGGGPVTILDGILNSPKKEAAAITSAAEKSGLLASMLHEKKEQQHLVNGHEQHEQYKKMNGNGKRPASTEPEVAGNEAKRQMMSQDANGVYFLL